MKTTIILITVLTINASDYFISFDFSSKNGVLTSYNFNCSKSMTYSDKLSKLLFKIKTPYKNIENLCKYNQNDIIKNLLKFKFYVSGNDKKTTKVVYSKIKGVFLPTLFDIIIKNNTAYFYLKGEN